jgi:hypothetical protein
MPKYVIISIVLFIIFSNSLLSIYPDVQVEFLGLVDVYGDKYMPIGYVRDIAQSVAVAFFPCIYHNES